MFDDLIYWIGVIVIIGFFVAVTLLGLWLLVCGFTIVMSKWLRRAYNHAQLFYFMSRLKRTGLRELVEDIDKFAATEKTKEERAQNENH